MKRFWKAVSITEEGGGWDIRLDGRPVRTPAREPLILPTRQLAEAVADEWSKVGEEINPRKMPLTGLANAAIDRVAPDREAFVANLAVYAKADLACYRVEHPHGLVDRHAERWDPVLAWGRRRYDVDFISTAGVIHVEQPAATVEQLTHAVASLDVFHLAGLSPLVTVGGSLVTALAILEKAITAEAGWDVVSVDEQWQLEQWGSDTEAEVALANRRCDFLAAARFLELLDA